MWLRHLVETLLEGNNPEEFLEHTKLELFQDQVFCFTPKGRLIALPRGATPIDFAYAVHTDVGNHAVGAIVNGRQMPLDTKLRNGDEVEILTSQHPPAAAGLGKDRRHRARPRRHPPCGPRGGAPPVRRAWPPPAVSAFERARIDYTDDKLKRALPRLAQKFRRGCAWPRSDAASCPSTDRGQGRGARSRRHRAGPACLSSAQPPRSRPGPGGLVQSDQGAGI